MTSQHSQSTKEQLWHITLVSMVMFLGCFVSGMIPLSTSLSQRKIQMCSLFGAGLLVGVALAVIIPEGVQSLFSIARESEEESTDNEGQTIGFSLIAGFVMMLLIDNIGGGHSHSHNPPTGQTNHALSNMDRGGSGRQTPVDYQRLSTGEREEANKLLLNNSSTNIHVNQHQVKSSSSTITLGLIVHAAADGIALGAASATDRSDLQFIVFLAIMLHKAPAAFGLTSVLLREHISHDRIRSNLFIFSLAAPVGAIATILVFSIFGGAEGRDNWNGPAIAMLFSAGTFLYVATVHVLPEVTNGKKLSVIDLCLISFGIILPLFLGMVTHGHGHSHGGGGHSHDHASHASPDRNGI